MRKLVNSEIVGELIHDLDRMKSLTHVFHLDEAIQAIRQDGASLKEIVQLASIQLIDCMVCAALAASCGNRARAALMLQIDKAAFDRLPIVTSYDE